MYRLEQRLINIEKQNERILHFLYQITKQNQMIMADLTALQAAVAAETTIDQSVATLLTTLANELATANAAGDQAAIDAIVTTMQQNATTLSAAIMANTPAAAAPTT